MADSKKSSILTVLHLFMLCLYAIDQTSAACTISKSWTNLTMEEYLSSAQIVVYGQTKEHRAGTQAGTKYTYIDAIFEVFCIIKSGEDPLPTEIVISEIAPRDGCSATKGNMQVGDEAILALRPGYGGKYQFHEVMPLISASYTATRAHLFAVAGMCGLQDWSGPSDATSNRCPVCGNANFTDVVMKADDNSFLNPCLINGMLFGNDTEICKMLMSQPQTTSQTCVPASFVNTCTDLIFSLPEAQCTCTYESLDRKNYSETDTGQGLMASVSLLAGTLLVSLFVVCYA